MSGVLRRLRLSERGFALPVALGMLLVLGIVGTAVAAYTSSNSRSSNLGAAQTSANQYAEAAMNAAYSVLNAQNNNASDTTLLHSSASLVCVSVATTCATSSTVGQIGTATYFGVYTDNTVPQYWTVYAIGYARNPTGGPVVQKTLTATITVVADTNDPRNVAVWNYLYSTAPPASGCEIDLTGTQVAIDIPIYVTGDLCLSGTQASVEEGVGGQKIDLRVQGKLVLSGTQSKVGTDPTHPITSGVVAGGCTTTISGTGHTCTSADRYYVGTADTPTTLAPPTADTAWYGNSDLGPGHGCAGLASSVFDTNTTQGDSVATFNLTPSSSYTCTSANGAGELSWNNATKILTVAGVIFFDGSVSASQSLVYQHPAGVTGATIYTKSFTLSGTKTTLCAVSSCSFASWDPNAKMLMFVALGSGTSISIGGTQGKFQGALFAQPTSTIALSGTQVDIQGPVVGGRFSWGTQTEIHPLPTINNLPPGAPLAYNARAVPGRLNFASG